MTTPPKKAPSEEEFPAKIKTTTKTNDPRLLRLTNLTREVQLEIFDHLDPVTSACLGLTCKALYAIHRKFHGSVELWRPAQPGSCEDKYACWKRGELHTLLRAWMPKDLMCSSWSSKREGYQQVSYRGTSK